MSVEIQLRTSPFDALSELAQYKKDKITHQSFGASSFFIGCMRDFNQGNSVKSMYLDYYPGMTDKVLMDIAQANLAEYDQPSNTPPNIFILHRVGQVNLGEDIVVVATWSAHRHQAFSLTQNIMEDLKSKAPFWKNELLVNGKTKWVN